MSRPRLAAKARLKWDELEQAHFLLWPERGMRLSPTAAAIVELCDGTRTHDEIAGELAKRFDDPRQSQIMSDVSAFVDELQRRALLVDA